MASGRKPDPRKKKSTVPHATNLKVANGKTEGAYIAGEMFGCYTHRTYASMPCMLDVTNDALPCPYCGSGVEQVWRGYVPLWDRDWTLRYVLIGEDYFASVDAIPHRTKVAVSRGKNPISPLIIREEPMLTRDLPNSHPWNVEIDALAICLRLWKNAELNEWFRCNPPKKEAPKPSGKKPPLKSDGKPFSPHYAAAAARYSAPDPSAIGDPVDAVRNRILSKTANLKPSTNGDRKH